MAKMRLLYKWRKKHINNIHQLCQHLAYLAYLATFGRNLAGIWQNEEAFIVAAFLLRFAFKSLSLRKSKTRSL